MVRCTYISIPQTGETREMILYKPSWIWGAEMGVNDARVAIGNEAVFTKAKRGEPALTGMDLLRLALERAGTAASAVEIMIALLEEHGQGGNCGYDKEFHYDNSFLVADPKEMYVLETSGKRYAVLKVEDRCAISNRLCIGTDHSKRAGLAAGEDFASRYSEPIRSHFSAAKQRREKVLAALTPSSCASDLMDILRTHAHGVQEFRRGSVSSVCMHAGGLIGDHTTGSLVAALRKDKPVTLWSTGCSTPCISAFKPVFWNSVSAPLFCEPEPSREYWLKREHIHRAAIAGIIDVTALRDRIGELEAGWQSRESDIMRADVPDVAALAALSEDADMQERALVDEFYTQNWRDIRSKGMHSRYWVKKNRELAQPDLG